jgi:iron-sulfur cluster repair protein YtfE (RIC family)
MTDLARNLTIDRSATVNEILVQYPATVAVFNSFGIDACCGGDAELAEAAQRDGVNVTQLIAALETAARDARTAQ